MKLETITNKILIGVERRLESMRNTYRKFHQYEIPVGNPIEKDIEKMLKVLHKFSTIKKINLSALAKVSGIGIKESGKNDSDEAYKNIPIGKSKKQGSSVNEEVFGDNTKSRCARMDNKMENNYEV